MHSFANADMAQGQRAPAQDVSGSVVIPPVRYAAWRGWKPSFWGAEA